MPKDNFCANCGTHQIHQDAIWCGHRCKEEDFGEDLGDRGQSLDHSLDCVICGKRGAWKGLGRVCSGRCRVEQSNKNDVVWQKQSNDRMKTLVQVVKGTEPCDRWMGSPDNPCVHEDGIDHKEPCIWKEDHEARLLRFNCDHSAGLSLCLETDSHVCVDCGKEQKAGRTTANYQELYLAVSRQFEEEMKDRMNEQMFSDFEITPQTAEPGKSYLIPVIVSCEEATQNDWDGKNSHYAFISRIIGEGMRKASQDGWEIREFHRFDPPRIPCDRLAYEVGQIEVYVCG